MIGAPIDCSHSMKGDRGQMGGWCKIRGGAGCVGVRGQW